MVIASLAVRSWFEPESNAMVKPDADCVEGEAQHSFSLAAFFHLLG
jgi:hypothetical protein